MGLAKRVKVVYDLNTIRFALSLSLAIRTPSDGWAVELFAHGPGVRRLRTGDGFFSIPRRKLVHAGHIHGEA